MQKKNIVMMLVTGCSIAMLTGCGVPEEEHLAALASQQEKFDAEKDALNQTIAEQETIIDNEKNKVRTARIELDDASERIKDLQQKSAETATQLSAEKTKVADLEMQLKTSKSQTAAAQDRASDAEGELSTLKVEFEELERRFEMFKKNMAALNSPSSPAPVASGGSDMGGIPGAQPTEPQSDAQRVKSLLDQMNTL